MLSILVNVVLLILILSLLIFLHELGHFVAAKISKVKVEAFAIGMGPNLFKKSFGETEYRLNLLPIGGYVSILGEVVEEEDDMTKAELEDPRNFQNKHPLVKIFILSAGVFVNLMTAVIIYYAFLMMSNFTFLYPSQIAGYEPLFGTLTTEVIDDLNYTELNEEGNAINSGWPEQGYIRSIGANVDELNNIELSSEFTDFTSANKGEMIYVEICEEPGSSCEIYSTQISEEGKVGILMANNYLDVIVYEGMERPLSGFVHATNMLHLSGVYLGNIFSDASESGDYTEAVNTFSGPVGLYVIIDRIKVLGVLGMLDLIANMSLILFFMNLLPIPALDGGRIVLVLVEWATGDKYSKNIEAWLIRITYVALMVFMFAVIIKDVIYFDELKELFSG